MNTISQIFAASAINITFDLIVFILPIPRLLQVQISRRTKIGISMTFLVGLFVTVCSLIRLAYLVRWRTTTNPTWTYSPIALWSIVECEIGIVCACMPALAGPIKRFWSKTLGTQSSNVRKSQTNGIETAVTGGHQRSGNRRWHNRADEDGEGKIGTNAIMQNVSLNVSDEIELMDKSSGVHGKVESVG